MRFKQICNHPAHFLGDRVWDEAGSGKLARLREILEAVAAKQEKVLVFTQFREATEPLAAFLTDVFGRPGLVLHGEHARPGRGGLVQRFQEDATRTVLRAVRSRPAEPGSTSPRRRTWCTSTGGGIPRSRIRRPTVPTASASSKNVLVHKLVCRGTVEERIDRLIEDKQTMVRGVLAGGGETLLTEMSDDELMAMVALDLRRATAEA